MNFSMTEQEKSDLLIEVTTWAGLAVHCLFNVTLWMYCYTQKDFICNKDYRLYKSHLSQLVDLVPSRQSHHIIKKLLFPTMILLKKCSFGIKKTITHPLTHFSLEGNMRS
jgi:hypothetical protein